MLALTVWGDFASYSKDRPELFPFFTCLKEFNAMISSLSWRLAPDHQDTLNVRMEIIKLLLIYMYNS